MDARFLEALLNWKNKGDRAFHIDCGAPNNPDLLQVWCFDYSVMFGSFVTKPEDLKTLDLVAKKQADLAAEQEKLNKMKEK